MFIIICSTYVLLSVLYFMELHFSLLLSGMMDATRQQGSTQSTPVSSPWFIRRLEAKTQAAAANLLRAFHASRWHSNSRRQGQSQRSRTTIPVCPEMRWDFSSPLRTTIFQLTPSPTSAKKGSLRRPGRYPSISPLVPGKGTIPTCSTRSRAIASRWSARR